MRIHRKIILTALAILLIGATSSSAAVKMDWATGADAYTLQEQFLSSGKVQTETFESFDHKDTPSLDIAFGTLSGGGYVSDNTGLQYRFGEFAAQGSMFYSNGDPDNTSDKYTYTVSLNTPQNALGFFGMDWQDIGGRVSLSLGGQTSQSVEFVDLLSDSSSKTLFYLTLFSDTAFDSITFYKSGGDGYAIDDLSVAATPIPGAVWLLGSGLLGLVGLRRKYA